MIFPLGYKADLFDSGAGTFESGTYGWVAIGTNTIANDAGQLKTTYGNSPGGSYTFFKASGDLSADLTVGSLYRLVGQVRVSAGNSVAVGVDTGGAVYIGLKTVTETSLTDYGGFFIATHATTGKTLITVMGAGEIIWHDNLVLREVN